MSDWISVKQYAEMFGVHVQTVYTAIREGKMNHPIERVGRAIRIDVSRGIIEERKSA